MILSHKIRIYPNREQDQFLKKSCGVARFVYNWGLAEWQKLYKNGEKPNHLKLKRQFNELKNHEFPFVNEVSCCCYQYAFSNLGKAYKNFFDRRTKFPRFKKKGIHDSFSITNQKFSVEYKAKMYGKHIYRVDRFFPSSKTCSNCGCVQEKMPLHVREWTCPDCGAHHDRDINAATNLLRQVMPEVTHEERLVVVISNGCDIINSISLNRERNQFDKNKSV